MAVALARGVQPLQQRAHPMWEYNGTDDSTRAIRKGFYEGRSLKDMLALMFKGEACLESTVFPPASPSEQ